MQSGFGISHSSDVETMQDLPEIFDRIILVSYRDGRARIGQAECRARTVFKINFELGLGLMNGFHFAPR